MKRIRKIEILFGGLILLGSMLACAPTQTSISTPASVPPTPTTIATTNPVPTTIEMTIPPATPVAASIQLNSPWDIALDAQGNLYIADGCGGPDHILKLDTSGKLTIIAGQGDASFAGDGKSAVAAFIACPTGLTLDPAGNLYFVDHQNNRVRKITPEGIITTVAGSGDVGLEQGSYAGDGGPATDAKLKGPVDVAVDADGNLYIADRDNNRVRKVDPQGIITTVAGKGSKGFSGDGGPATEAELGTAAGRGPMSIALDAEGNLFISEGISHRVRKVDNAGIITTVAGNGEAGFSGDGGLATEAKIDLPWGLAFDADGDLYIADGAGRIRKVDKAGIITTFAGRGRMSPGPLGDGGPATEAYFLEAGIAFDAQGNLYVVDNGHRRVRKIDKSGIVTTVVGGD